MSLHRIAIVGAGALGSYVGARLAQAAQTVVLIGRGPHMQAIGERGLLLRCGEGEIRLPMRATTAIAAAGDADLVLVCVKSADTAAAAQSLLPVLRSQALVLSLQNGVGNAQLLADTLPQPVLAGLAYVAAALPEPGVVQHSGGRELVLGAVRASEAQVRAAAALLQGAAFAVRAVPDVRLQMWNKLIVNCACNAISALTQAPYSVMAQVAAVRELQQAVLRECVAVAQAEGQAVVPAELSDAVERVALNMPHQRSSTAQDLARGRPTEIDHLNGHIVRCGQRHGIPTPANQALLALVKLATRVQGAR